MEGVEAGVIKLFAIVAEDLPTATQALLGSGEPVRRWLTLCVCSPAGDYPKGAHPFRRRRRGATADQP